MSSRLCSKFDSASNVRQSISHTPLNHVVHGRVSGEDESFEHGGLVNWVAEALLIQIGSPAAHGLDQALVSAQVPVMQAW